MITFKRYTPSESSKWDSLVDESKNGTFLFRRQFMDYHNDRFEDCSLIFEKKGRPLCCFPANYSQSDNCVYSHQGLTYGGFILDKHATLSDVMEMFDMISGYYKEEYGVGKIIYKPIPHIYSIYPSEEDLYCLFRREAKLISRGLSSTIVFDNRLRFSASRRECIRKGQKLGLHVCETRDTDDIKAYWEVLNSCLLNRHNTSPVHSSKEMSLLMERFPDNISLVVSKDASGEILSGTWMFIDKHTIHIQYLASSEHGRSVGALDVVLNWVIENYSHKMRYLDFGVSTETGGQILNNGLLFQKEGFGGRAVCYDTYELSVG